MTEEQEAMLAELSEENREAAMMAIYMAKQATVSIQAAHEADKTDPPFALLEEAANNLLLATGMVYSLLDLVLALKEERTGLIAETTDGEPV